jgi:hypothetical protein
MAEEQDKRTNTSSLSEAIASVAREEKYFDEMADQLSGYVDMEGPPPGPSEMQGGIVALMKALAENTRLQGQGYASGNQDYGNDWTGNSAGVSGEVSTAIPIEDFMLGLKAQGYGFRNQVTSPENNQDIYSGGQVTGGGLNLTDNDGRTFGVDYDRNDPRRFMFRGKVPF